MLSANGMEKPYHDFIEIMVYNKQPGICMINHCESYSGIELVKLFLQDLTKQKYLQISEANEDGDGLEEIVMMRKL